MDGCPGAVGPGVRPPGGLRGAGFCQPAPGGGAGHRGTGRRSGSALEGLLLRLGGKPGIAGERDGPYLLLQGLVRLLNYEVTKEALEEEEGGFG